ncbi:MAG TPA: ABC transporter permease [Solirubrobacteraceae bacterium]|nr:ABC transporter permease [Solirubrobacteraceae bacterium]
MSAAAQPPLGVSGATRRRGLPWRRRHPIAHMAIVRLALGVVTLFAVSVLIFLATQALPGNAAYAVLGHSATPQRLHALEAQLHLNESLVAQYGHWIGGVLRGDFGTSLANGESVSALIGPRIVNSAVLVFLAGIIGSLLATAMGLIAAARRDGWFDHVSSVGALTVTAMPEFVVGIAVVIIFAINVFHLFPAVSVIPPGTSPLSNVSLLVLPVLTLSVVIAPYIFRMMRAAMIEALESDYVEMAELKGLSRRRILLVHALPNALPPVIQVIGLNLLYLAGGIVVVEYIFNYPGLGAALVAAVSDRDIPTIQFLVLMLAAFYVAVNIVTDMLALWASPRRRAAR